MSKKYHWLKRGLALAVLQLGLSSQPLFADWGCCDCNDEWNSELDLSFGYRRDTLTARIDVHDANDRWLVSDHIKIKDMDIYQLGLKGRLGYCDWFVRGYAYWGWIHDGKYTDTASFDSYDLNASFHADIDGRHTEDYTLGVGYLFNFCSDFYVGPVVGWSYHRQKPRIKHARFCDSSSSCSWDNSWDDCSCDDSSVGNDLHYTAKWQGPWLGIDFIYQYCDFIFDFGYEYHWANWSGAWSLGDSEGTAADVSHSHKSKRVHGNLFYVDARWVFCDCWDLGIGFIFRDFRSANHHHSNCSSSGSACCDSSSSDSWSNDCSGNLHHKARVKWHSATVTLDLGYAF